MKTIYPVSTFYRSNRTRGCHGRDHMIVGFKTTCEISVIHHSSCEFEPRSLRDILYSTLCDKVRQLIATRRWFSPGTPISSTNKTDRHDLTEILLKVTLNTISQKPSNGKNAGCILT